jgi:hypothetical protein
MNKWTEPGEMHISVSEIITKAIIKEQLLIKLLLSSILAPLKIKHYSTGNVQCVNHSSIKWQTMRQVFTTLNMKVMPLQIHANLNVSFVKKSNIQKQHKIHGSF